jgi:hypothetical protein
MHHDTDKPSASTAAKLSTGPAVDTPDPDGAPATPVSPQDRGRMPEVDQLVGLLRALGDLWDFKLPIRRRRPDVVDELSFADVVGYFAEQHPGDPRIAAGALLCQPHPKGRLVFLVFLDGQDRPCRDASGVPYGRRMVAASLDAELTDRLRGEQTLIFR